MAKSVKMNYQVIPSVLIGCGSKKMIDATRAYMADRENSARGVAGKLKVKADNARVEEQLRAAEAVLEQCVDQKCEVLITFINCQKK